MSDQKKKLIDQIQDYFYHGDDDDESMINLVFDYMKNNKEILKKKNIKDRLQDLNDSYPKLREQNNEFEDEYNIVYNQLKPDFDFKIYEETVRRLNKKNSNNQDNIQKEVHDTNPNFASILSIFDNEKKIKKHE
ncbi:788_t:CDS:1 [Cetraspora pellucida]|uniref:788_t:CDS:1 n=1 Tax=Cetraspora pellucida TaxID=1433469 RepID=A0ACA9KBF7_9GLOM|nr:788_t:CDS:1 [Cetraspora pellucida]